jgi:hypothetical protein
LNLIFTTWFFKNQVQINRGLVRKICIATFIIFLTFFQGLRSYQRSVVPHYLWKDLHGRVWVDGSEGGRDRSAVSSSYVQKNGYKKESFFSLGIQFLFWIRIINMMKVAISRYVHIYFMMPTWQGKSMYLCDYFLPWWWVEFEYELTWILFITHFSDKVLLDTSHHSKTPKDGWAKYIPNFVFKWC